MPDVLQEKLVSYIHDAYALEQSAHRMLGTMISQTEDPEIREALEHHREETERHQDLLKQRLEAYGAGGLTVKEAAGIGGAVLKSFADRARGDKPAKNARDGFVIEQLEIANYELLERFAKEAGDKETAEIAKRNRGDEEAMAKKISKNWDKFVELTLAEAQVTV